MDDRRGIPEIAQAVRLGHHIDDRLAEIYSHVAPEVERRLLRALERRWKLSKRWSPVQISRWLRRRYRRRPAWHVCVETIYEAERRLLDQSIVHVIYLEDEQIPGIAALANAMPDRLSTLA